MYVDKFGHKKNGSKITSVSLNSTYFSLLRNMPDYFEPNRIITIIVPNQKI